MTIISNNISKTIAILNKQDVIAIPTAMLKGVEGHIYRKQEIRKVFGIKTRTLFNPLIVLMYSIQRIQYLVSEFLDKAKIPTKACWPGFGLDFKEIISRLGWSKTHNRLVGKDNKK